MVHHVHLCSFCSLVQSRIALQMQGRKENNDPVTGQCSSQLSFKEIIRTPHKKRRGYFYRAKPRPTEVVQQRLRGPLLWNALCWGPDQNGGSVAWVSLLAAPRRSKIQVTELRSFEASGALTSLTSLAQWKLS